jgi:acyl transferase domain-containing protein/acyl carrier protein
MNTQYSGLEIAIVGMACRLPGAANWREFWDNLVNGRESVRFYSPEEMPENAYGEGTTKGRYVGARAALDNKDHFDSAFFGYRPDEAALLHPCHRIFHECVWEAMEDAGYFPGDGKIGLTGLFAGAGDDLNWKVYSMLVNKEKEVVDDFFLHQINNEKFLTSLLAYKLDLKGPSFFQYTACSTSLVAIHLACNSLLLGEERTALAGGVFVVTRKEKGYLYHEGSIHSADGHCRAFDKDSTGTTGGEGAGVIVLKRLADAIADRDQIYSIIKGSSINNDGLVKVGFTAPGVEGQADCIRRAHVIADVRPDSIGYIEAHGTGTRLGDPIEIEALNMAFGGDSLHRCGVGSVKTNIGHVDAAAGVAGVIKTALALKYGVIPASLHYKEPNPEINFSGGPFYVNADLRQWERKGNEPRRAGVNSFGIGGTNAHVILEEAPERAPGSGGGSYHLLTLSARAETALERYATLLQDTVKKDATLDPADISYTLQTGRKPFEYRQSFVYDDRQELISLLDIVRTGSQSTKSEDRSGKVVFVFPGTGSQYANMGWHLYEERADFRGWMDEGFAILKEETGIDYRTIVFPDQAMSGKINEMLHLQPMIFLFEYSLGRLLISLGIKPDMMIGHSLGEYVAACLSGVFSFENGLKLVMRRGQLMDKMTPGGMISAFLPEAAAAKYVHQRLSVAAVNGAGHQVFSGDIPSVDELLRQLEADDIPYMPLHTSCACHSYMVDEITAAYRAELEKITFHPPTIPYISNITGEQISPEDAVSSGYWLLHMRHAVQFARGIDTIVNLGKTLFVEVGPGHSLTNLVNKHSTGTGKITGVNMIRHPKEMENDVRYFADRIGKLWAAGVAVDWENYYGTRKGLRIPLPTYAFEPSEYPAEVDAFGMLAGQGLATFQSKQSFEDRFYRAFWKNGAPLPGKRSVTKDSVVLVLADEHNLAERLCDYLKEAGIRHIAVTRGPIFGEGSAGFVLDPGNDAGYDLLFEVLRSREITPTHLFHCWNYGQAAIAAMQDAVVSRQAGYDSLLNIARGFYHHFPQQAIQIDVIGNGWYRVLGDETIIPDRAIGLGAVKVIPMEFPGIACRAIDIPELSTGVMTVLWRELMRCPDTNEIAIRGANRYVRDFEKVHWIFSDEDTVFRDGGTYLITGANGGMAKSFAVYFADKFHANLILTGRRELSPELAADVAQKGGKVFYIQCDISDATALAEGIRRAGERFGVIHGVIHAAGLGDYAGMILRRSRQDDEKIFAPKIDGTRILDSIFCDKQLDFFVNCSSQAASVAAFGQVAYVAANLYQDAIAERGNRSYPVISIEWTTLLEVGMAVAATSHLDDRERDRHLRLGITPAEACRVLSAVIQMKLPVPIISTVDLRKYYQDQYLNFSNTDLNGIDASGEVKRSRPVLSGAYTAPVTDTEKRMSALWEGFFGISSLGTEDNFFELGGDSLKAMILLKKIKTEFDIDLSVKSFFNAPTVGKAASYIDAMKADDPQKTEAGMETLIF